jgi:hypothetical protein
MFSVFAAASTVAIMVLIILPRKWNIILRKEVKRRTMELEESYDEMKCYLQDVLKELKNKKWGSNECHCSFARLCDGFCRITNIVF